jgi:hypothetical protein
MKKIILKFSILLPLVAFVLLFPLTQNSYQAVTAAPTYQTTTKDDSKNFSPSSCTQLKKIADAAISSMSGRTILKTKFRLSTDIQVLSKINSLKEQGCFVSTVIKQPKINAAPKSAMLLVPQYSYAWSSCNTIYISHFFGIGKLGNGWVMGQFYEDENMCVNGSSAWAHWGSPYATINWFLPAASTNWSWVGVWNSGGYNTQIGADFNGCIGIKGFCFPFRGYERMNYYGNGIIGSDNFAIWQG